MTLIKYWCCFPHSHNCGVRVRHFNLTLPSFNVYLFSSLSDWTRCSSWKTALSLLSCHDCMYVNVRWSRKLFKVLCISPDSVSSPEQSWILYQLTWFFQVLILQYCPISRKSQIVEQYACPSLNQRDASQILVKFQDIVKKTVETVENVLNLNLHVVFQGPCQDSVLLEQHVLIMRNVITRSIVVVFVSSDVFVA